MLAQLAIIDSDSIVIRGLPHNTESISANSKMRMINFAGAAELNKLICNANVVISRSGYTTVMDLLKLQKKAILIPTPGQPEQEYLGRYLSRLQLAVVANQETLNLSEELAKIDSLKEPKELTMEGYKEFCSAELLAVCSNGSPDPLIFRRTSGVAGQCFQYHFQADTIDEQRSTERTGEVHFTRADGDPVAQFTTWDNRKTNTSFFAARNSLHSSMSQLNANTAQVGMSSMATSVRLFTKAVIPGL